MNLIISFLVRRTAAAMFSILLIGIVLLLFPLFLPAQVKLPELVSNGMVLQRDIPLPVWGWAKQGDKITLDFRGKSYTAITTEDGKWKCMIDPQPAGGPYTMQISSGKFVTEITDILMGDVWFCSGQSNMAFKMKQVEDLYATDIAASANPQIRMFEVRFRASANPEINTPGAAWQKADPASLPSFSAVAYFFGNELYQKYKVPVGLINASVGGTVAEAWTSKEGLKEFPDYLNRLKLLNDPYIVQQEQVDLYVSTASKWIKSIALIDKGFSNGRPSWSRPDFDASSWKKVNMPDYWQTIDSLQSIDGIVWFRKDIILSEIPSGQNAQLLFSNIDDIDQTYFNGTLIGTGFEKKAKRIYTIPSALMKKGKNVIVHRIINRSINTGIYGKAPMELVINNNRFPLNGEWQYSLSAPLSALPAFPAVNSTSRNEPAYLFNGMVHPIMPYAIKGVIWYQGESNAGKAFEYQRLFPALISDWRQHWQQGNFPFLYVQLANYHQPVDTVGKSPWAELREAQFKTLEVPNTGMAVISDIGEAKNIHPKNKKDVGRRLALAAQKLAYHEKALVHSGPLYKVMKITGNKIEISFDLYGAKLAISDNKPLQQFAIAGKDKKFRTAKAVIKNDTVIVWSDDVSAPVAVRYGWADNPAGSNLYNNKGLPASPFRTDDWQE